jgi:hypothetical protein
VIPDLRFTRCYGDPDQYFVNMQRLGLRAYVSRDRPLELATAQRLGIDPNQLLALTMRRDGFQNTCVALVPSGLPVFSEQRGESWRITAEVTRLTEEP